LIAFTSASSKAPARTGGVGDQPGKKRVELFQRLRVRRWMVGPSNGLNRATSAPQSSREVLEEQHHIPLADGVAERT
jgi:hypothetical protein